MTAQHSLHQLLTRYALLYLALIAFSCVLGGAGFYFWRQSSDESLRLNAMMSDMQSMRGAMYRQLKEVFDAVFLNDPAAPAEHRDYGAAIAAQLARLRTAAASEQERAAIEQLDSAYRAVQRESVGVMAALPQGEAPAQRHVLDVQLEQGPLREYERAFAAAESFLRAQQERLSDELRRLTWLALLLLALPLATATFMLVLSRRFMRKTFVEPVSSLMQATARISSGDLDHPVPPHGAAELQQLAVSVNRMAGDLAQSRTELLKAERQAALGALVPVVAHNIRNPLASIRATAQVLDEPGLSGEVRQGLRDIIATTDRLERWTHALLSYLHPLKPQLQRAELTRVADAALSLLEHQVQTSGVRVRREQWDADSAVWLDAQLVEQALHGLIANAIEATPRDGLITLTAQRDGAHAMMHILDQGAGLPFAELPSSGNLAPGPTTKRHGSGLGIPFALKVCEVHGGSLRFGAGQGGGTQVTLVLPRERSAPQDEALEL